MATGFQDSGVDLDDILEPRTTTKIADTGFQSNGSVDISNRFENITSGSAPGVTGFQKNGSDLNTLFAAEGTIGPTVSPIGDGQETVVNYTLTGNCYAGIQFNSNGIEYERDESTGAFNISKGAWLDSGSASEVWVEYVNTAGSSNFNQANPGAGRHNLATTRSWQQYRVSYGESWTTGYFEFWDAATGGNSLGTSNTSEWSCERVSPTISMSSAAITRTTTDQTCYAQLRFNAGGTERCNTTNGLNNYNLDHGDGTWLDAGLNTDIWLSREITAGSLTVDSGGTVAAPVVMSTQRSYGVSDTVKGGSVATATVVFKMWDKASGGSQIGSTATVNFSAEYESLTISPAAPSLTYEQDGTQSVQNNHCYVGIQFKSDGTQKRNNGPNQGSWTANGNWLDSGSAGDCWVQWDGSGFNYDNEGAGRHNLGTTRTWEEYRLSIGESSTGSGTWRFWDAASGGTEIATISSRTYTARRVPIVSPRLDGAANTRLNASCYSGFQINSSGSEFEFNNAGNTVSSTTWLDDGTNSQVWVEFIRTGGTLSDFNSLGAINTRYQCSTTRNFRIIRTTIGVSSIIGYCRFWNAATGGQNFYTSGTVTWSAAYDVE